MKGTIMTLLLWVMLIAVGMAIGYALASNQHSAAPFEPKHNPVRLWRV